MKRTNVLMRVFAVLMLAMVLVSSFAVSASAADADISATCPKSGDEKLICEKLQSIYGTTSTIKYSTTESDICKYSTSITLSSGKVVTVYLSQKPSTGDIGVQMGNDGRLEIDGISSDDNHNFNEVDVKYCSVNDKDALCKAIVDLYANDLSQHQQRISYKTEKTDTYKYEAEFETSGLTYVLYFNKLPSGTESTNKCTNGYVTEKVCRRLYDVVGNNTPFSLRYTPFFRYSAEIELEDGNTTTIWLLTELTQEQEYALMFDKRPIENDGASLKQIITTSVFFGILGIGLFVAIFVIVSKRKRA